MFNMLNCRVVKIVKFSGMFNMLNCRVVKIVKFSGSLNMLNCRVVKHVKMVKVSGALNMLNCRVVGQHLVKPSRLYGRPNIWNILLRGIIPKIMKF